jgi:hypothetical protein
MFWSQLLLWLSGLPVIFFGILGTMFGVILVSGTEIDDAAGDLRNGHFYRFTRIRSEATCGAVTAASFGIASLRGIAVGPWAHDMILLSESV